MGMLACIAVTVLGGLTCDRAMAEVRLAQLSLPEAANVDITQPPPNVRKIGGAEIAPVYFQGQILFEVASLSVLDRENPGGSLPVEIRANRIEDDLDYIVSFTNPDLVAGDRDYRTVYDPASFEVQVQILNSQIVVTASDDYRTAAQVLATVTETDAEYYGLSQREVADLWRDRIYSTLSQALQDRSPQALQSWLLMAGSLLTGLVALWVGCRVLHRRLSRVKHQLDRQRADTAATPDVAEPLVPSVEPAQRRGKRPRWLRTLAELTGDLSDRISLLNFSRWLLVWVQVLAWVIAIASLINRYPLRQITAWEVLLKPQLILVVWFMAGLGNRLLNFLIGRAATLQQSTVYSSDETRRRQLRISTTANVISGLKTVFVYLLAIVFTLNILGLNTNSLLAFGALLGFAISLAAQNVIKDLVNGFLVLLEDQYAIGDVIEIDDNTSGLVENLNLRVTQLRDGEGRLITLPNSQIARVVNLTRLWARVDESVFVSANANIHQALAVVESTAQDLYNDPQFRPVIIEAPTVLGVEKITHEGIEIHAQIKTKPSEQWTLAREFRLRLKTALDDKGIALGRPQRDVWHHSTHREDDL